MFCLNTVDILEGVITHEHFGAITNVRSAIVIVDFVLQLEDTFINLCNQNLIFPRVALSDTEAHGKFVMDIKAQVVSFVSNVAPKPLDWAFLLAFGLALSMSC